MCVVSNLGDFYSDRFRPYVPNVYPSIQPSTQSLTITTGISRQEFDALKAEVAEMRDLLIAAKRMDEVMGEPDCEMAEKVALLRAVADAVGVDLADVFGPSASSGISGVTAEPTEAER